MGLSLHSPHVSRLQLQFLKMLLLELTVLRRGFLNLRSNVRGINFLFLGWRKDLQVSQLPVNEYIHRAKSLQLELDGAREELATT